MGHQAASPAPPVPLGLWEEEGAGNEEMKLSLEIKGAVVRYFYFCLCFSPHNSIVNWQ